MKIVFYEIVFFYFIFILTCSALDFKEGYLVSSKGDTLRGLIQYQKKKQTVLWKSSYKAEPVYFSTENSRGFSIRHEEVFQVIEIERLGKMGKVFAEVLVLGRVTLYRYKEMFFAKKDSDSIIQLKVIQKEDYRNGQKYSITDKKYYQDLKTYLMADCNKVDSLVFNLELRQDKLITLFQEYNKCVGSSYIIPLENQPWVQNERYLYIGANKSSINFSSPERRFNYLTNPTYVLPISPILGYQIHIKYPRLNKNIGFQTGLFVEYKSVRSQDFVESGNSRDIYGFSHYLSEDLKRRLFPVYSNYTFVSTIHSNEWLLKIPFSLRFQKGSTKKYSYYILSGLNANIHLYARNEVEVSMNIEGQGTTKFTTLAYYARPVTLSFTGSLGLQKNAHNAHKIFAELKAEQSLTGPLAKSSDVQEHLLNKSSIFSLGLLVGYSF